MRKFTYRVEAHCRSLDISYTLQFDTDRLDGAWTENPGTVKIFSNRIDAVIFAVNQITPSDNARYMSIIEDVSDVVFRISNKFDRLGDPREIECEEAGNADIVAADMRVRTKLDVTNMQIPEHIGNETGDMAEIVAWREAGDISGAVYDDAGNKISGPEFYSDAAGKYISQLAIEIEEIEMEFEQREILRIEKRA
jgi:hypothetical protein